MPWSCSRCTNRSRVRAEVMPIPLRRGPSIKLLKFQPTLQLGQRRMTRQVDLQRRDGCITLRDRMKVGAGPCVLARAGGSDPIDISATRVLRTHYPLRSMTIAETRHFDTAQRPVWQIRHIHVEDYGPLQW